MSIDIADFVNEDDLPDFSSATDLCAKYHVRDLLGRYCLIFQFIFLQSETNWTFFILYDFSLKTFLLLDWKTLNSIFSRCLSNRSTLLHYIICVHDCWSHFLSVLYETLTTFQVPSLHHRFILFMSICSLYFYKLYLKLQISTAPTKVKSWEPAYSQALNY